MNSAMFSRIFRQLSVDHLVMRERQYEVLLGKCVDHREGQLVVVILPVNGIFGHVPQRVVHHSHVQVKSQPSHIRRPRQGRPRRGFFGDGQRTRTRRVRGIFVQPSYKTTQLSRFSRPPYRREFVLGASASNPGKALGRDRVPLRSPSMWQSCPSRRVRSKARKFLTSFRRN